MYRFAPAFIYTMNMIKYSRRTRDIFGKGLLCLCFKRLEKNFKGIRLKNMMYYSFVICIIAIGTIYFERFWNDHNIFRFYSCFLSLICAIIPLINCETPDLFFFHWNAILCCRLQFNILFTD